MTAETSTAEPNTTPTHNGRNMKRFDSAVDAFESQGAQRTSVDNDRRPNNRPPRSRARTKRPSTSTKQEVSGTSDEEVSSAHQSTGTRRDSLGSSGASSSSKPRRGKSGSRRSSRTAYSIQDPSRPPLPYRANTTPSVTTSRRDVDDVLALHYRSCTLFSTVSATNTLPSDSKAQHSRSESISAVVPTSLGKYSSVPTPTVPETSSVDHDDSISPIAIPSTVNYWTSAHTRRKEYEAIDRGNQGIAGLFRRLTPRWCPGSRPPAFYDHEKQESDAGSVRRYRLDLPDESDDEFEHDEKEMKLLKPKARRPRVSRGWSCF